MNKKIPISWKATFPLGIVFLVVGLFFLPALLGYLVLAPAGLIFVALAFIDLFRKKQVINTAPDQPIVPPTPKHSPWPVAGLIILILAAIVASAIVVYKQNKKETQDILANVPLTHRVEWRTYQSAEFEFEISYPNEIYSPTCKTFTKVEANETNFEDFGIIRLGGNFDCNPLIFYGYALFAGKYIATEESARFFIKSIFGDGCTIEGWTGNDFHIVNDLQDNSTVNEGVNACDLLSTEYSGKYSPEKQVLVIWSLNKQPEFYYSDSEWYDDDVNMSFNFINP